MSAPTTPLAVKLDAAVLKRVKRLAASKGRTPHWVMKEAVCQYVDREEKREAFWRDASASLEEYEATGLHVTADEVIDWLDTWGRKNEKTPPQCHK